MNRYPFSYRLVIDSENDWITLSNHYVTLSDNIETYNEMMKIARTLFKVNPTHQKYSILSADNGYWYGNVHRTDFEVYKD